MDTGSLQLMFQNGMPSMGAIGLGQGQAADRDMAAQKLREMSLKNDQSAVMNPLDALFRQGQITQQGAELPGLQGLSASRVAQGGEDMALMSSKIASKLSTMYTQMGSDGVQQANQDAEKLAHAALIIKDYPPAMQKQVLQKVIEQYGGSMKSPIFQGLMQAPDDKVQPAAEALARGLQLAGKEWTQKAEAEATATGSRERVAAGNNDTSIEVARINAEAKKAVQEARGHMLKFMTSDQQLTALTAIPQSERTPEDSARILELSQQRIAEKTGSANAVPATVLNQKTPQQAGNDTAATIHSNPGRAQPAADPSDLATLAKKQGLPYDPSKFKYRVGPNGQLQSAPK